MAVVRCQHCQVEHRNMGPAALPFCRKCISELPEALRRPIMHNAPGNDMRSRAEAAARELWHLPPPKAK